MAEFKLPDLGENIEEAEVLKVLVSEGDGIEKDENVLELETDKATFELPSTVSGIIRKVHVSEGDKVRLGQTILTVDEGEATPGKKKEKKGKREEEKEPRPGKGAPAEGEATEEPRRKEEKKGEEPPAEERTGEEARDEEGGAGEPEEAPREEEEEQEGGKEEKKEPRPSRDHEVVAGPATRRLARELGIDLARVEGRSPAGRITADDVKAAARGRREPTSEGAEGAAALPDFERFGPVERRRLSGIERAAALHLSSSWRTIPHVTQHDLADVTELERMRRRFEETRRPSDPKLAPTALVVKAVVAALKAFPRVNASLDAEREELVLKRYYHIGVAVDTEYGLVVPVVRDADHKTTRQIAAEIASLAERARERKLTRDEMQGASFTVTNLGGIGGTSFTPIVSHPEVAILGVSRVREEPVVRDGEIAVRLVMPLSLSYDHRAINGADAARFVRHLASLLEDPLRLLVES